MSETTSLVFLPDGRGLALYTELIGLSTLGSLYIKRLSRIEFDDELQAWRVKDTRGFALFTAPTRQQCLDWECEYFDSQLERMAS